MEIHGPLYLRRLSFRGRGQMIGSRKGPKEYPFVFCYTIVSNTLRVVPFITRLQLFITSCRLLGHVLEGLGQVLRTEGELADGPDLRVLFVCGLVVLFWRRFGDCLVNNVQASGSS